MIENIVELNASSGTVAVVGDIFDVDTKELKTENTYDSFNYRLY